MLHLPILRGGEAYRSLDAVELRDVVTGSPVARVSQASPGLISRDLAAIDAGRRAMKRHSVAELLGICAEAAGRFMEDDFHVLYGLCQRVTIANITLYKFRFAVQVLWLPLRVNLRR